MKRKLRHTLFIFILSVSLAFAQHTAPDFTVTDFEGETHQLYADYLHQGKTVVIDFFFVDCPPCKLLHPYMQTLYQDWGAGENDVQFIGLTVRPSDSDIKLTIHSFSHPSDYPMVSADGGSIEAATPYLEHNFGEFTGTPAIAIIAPDGSLRFDISGFGGQATADAIDEAIRDTGALPPSEVTSVDTAPDLFEELLITPNPAKDFATINFTLNESAEVNIQVYNVIGQSVMEVFDGTQYPGYHQIEVDAAKLRPGIYFVRVMANDEVRTMRFAKSYKKP